MLIRNMNRDDIEFAYQCTSSEGWEGETREVFECFLACHPRGCFVAENDAEKIAVSIATPYRNNGFIGELVVVKQMRGRGYGHQLFDHTFSYLKSLGLENIYLDADENAVSLYEKFGFGKITRSLRFKGKITGKKDPLVHRMTSRDLDIVCETDKEMFTDDRQFFLKRRYDLFPELCLVAKNKDSILGYVFGRPGVNVISVAPLAVLNDDNSTARALIQTLAAESKNQPLYAGVLESNTSAVAFFKSLKMAQVTPGWYMVCGMSDTLGTGKNLYSIGSAAKG